MKTSDIKGIIPPVITPMNNDDEQTVNHEALREQVERLLAGGVHGMFPLGTNGEAYALSFKEKEEILATVIDQVKGSNAASGKRFYRIPADAANAKHSNSCIFQTFHSVFPQQ